MTCSYPNSAGTRKLSTKRSSWGVAMAEDMSASSPYRTPTGLCLSQLGGVRRHWHRKPRLCRDLATDAAEVPD